MKNKYIPMLGSFVLWMAGPAVAGRQTPEPIPQRAEETPLQKLERAVREDQFMIEHPAFGEKPVVADARRKAAEEKLAKDQAALEEFKTAGPMGFQRARLNEAIDYDKWVIETGGGESKLVQREARIKAARENLARHEAALSDLR
jgi:hypothetical protein